MKSRINLLIGAASIATLSAHAAIVNLQTDNTSPQSTTALTGFSTLGDGMDGMKITATFANGSSDTAFWADTGASSGAAVGSGWSLAESGDTFGSLWTLSNSGNQGLVRLFIDAGLGGAIFDVNFDNGVIGSGASGSEGTPGSARGWSFELNSGDASLNILAVYSGPVGLGAAAPVGDLYRFLDLRFQNTGGLSGGSLMKYVTDTDSAKFGSDDIRPTPDLFSTGLALGLSGLGLAAFRRKSA